MRTFNAISSWLLWTIVVLYWLGSLFIRVVNTIPPVATEPSKAASYTNLFWYGMAICFGVALVLHLALRFYWYRPRRSPGFGFWLLSILLYLFVLAASESGFAPYFAVGDRSIIQWVGLALGAVLLILSFPRLPAKPPQLPPPIPTQ